MQTEDAPQAAFRYSCLGPVALTGPDGVSLDLRTRKLLALILLLARQAGKPLSRDGLIELLWPKDSEKKARHSLSQSVSLINKALGVEAIASADKDRVVLKPNVLWLDANAFERSAAAGDQAEARRLWRGTLLEGIWIPRAPGFERWLADERNRLERARRRVAHEIIEEARAEGDYQGMRAEAESLLELDPLDEKAMQAFLEALQLAGDRTLALRRYTEFEKRLKEELDAEPGSALRGWARRNRRGDSGAGLRYVPIPRVSEITVLPSPQPIFGRVEEYALLWNAWEQTKTGKGAFIVLEGDAGIGKTALATKLANQVHVAGGSVCFVKCYRTEKSVPFAPATALIRQLSRLPGFVALDPVWIGELTRLVPELRERYPNAPQPMAVDDAARHRLSDAIVQAAIAVADEQPLLVVVDDLQDADEATLAALHYLGRQTPGQPMLAILARRLRHEVSDFERTFTVTARSAGFARFVELLGLDVRNMEKLTLQVLARKGEEVREYVVRDIVDKAAGNPLTAIEAALAPPNTGAAPEPIVSKPEVAVDSFAELAADRISRLSRTAQLVLRTVALAGRPLSDYEIAQATALGPTVLEVSMRELEDAHFARRGGAGIFPAHERYSAVAVATATEDENQATHVRLAELFAASAARNPAARYEVALHLEQGQRRSAARSQALAAARYACSVGATREQASALELALRVSRIRSEEVVADLGDCYLTMNDLARLRDLCNSSNCSAPPTETLTYLRIACDCQAGTATLEQTEADLAVLLERAASFPYRAAAQLLLMRTADKTGHYELVRSLARQMRRDHCGSNSLSYPLLATAYVFLKYYQPRRALPLLEQTVSAAEHERNWAIEQLGRDGMGIALLKVGRYRESIAQYDYSLALARKTLNPQAEASALQNRAVTELALGDYAQALCSMDSADRLNVRSPYSIYSCYNRAVLHLFSDRLDKAHSGFEETIHRASRAKHRALLIEALSCMCIIAARRRDWNSMSGYLGRLTATMPVPDLLLCGWANTTALAWATAVLHGTPEVAMRFMDSGIRDVARRDIPHWLSLRLEKLYLQEFLEGGRNDAERVELRALARKFEASMIESAAT